MLAGVDESLTNFGWAGERLQDGSGLHEIGASAYDMENVH
jgi:hypothetical protein